jgi:hypothetical protein
MFYAADGLVHREHLAGDSDFSKELWEKVLGARGGSMRLNAVDLSEWLSTSGRRINS